MKLSRAVSHGHKLVNWWKRVYTAQRCSCVFPRRAWSGLSNAFKKIVNQIQTETTKSKRGSNIGRLRVCCISPMAPVRT